MKLGTIGNVIQGAGGLIDTVFEIHDNTSRGVYNQFGYEHLILVNGCGNQYKPIEIDGVILDIEWMIKCGFKENIKLEPHSIWLIEVKEKECEPYPFLIYQKREHLFYQVSNEWNGVYQKTQIRSYASKYL